jgi:hypothetical protein
MGVAVMEHPAVLPKLLATVHDPSNRKRENAAIALGLLMKLGIRAFKKGDRYDFVWAKELAE